MEPLFNFLGNYWWLVFVFGGMAGGWAKSISKANERRHRRKVELYKLKNQQVVAEQASQAEVAVLMAAHDAVNHKWLDYELDVGKLIDYPLMSDVREPLTVAFLRAKKEADGLTLPPVRDTSRHRYCNSHQRDMDGCFGMSSEDGHGKRDRHHPDGPRVRFFTQSVDGVAHERQPNRCISHRPTLPGGEKAA